MSLETRIKEAETHVFKVVFPDITNHHNTMFGGRILLMMTETAFMTAARFSRKNFVIVSSGQVDFNKPIPAASMVELVGTVDKIGNTSIRIKVRVFMEKIKEAYREEVVSGTFTLVAVDEHNKPVKVYEEVIE